MLAQVLPIASHKKTLEIMIISVRVDLKKILKKSRISSGQSPRDAPGVIPIAFGGTASFPVFSTVFLKRC